jgi:hypothetical protein
VSKWVKIGKQHFDIINISVQYNISEHRINWRSTNRNIPGPIYGASSCDITIIFNISDSKNIYPIFDNRIKFDMMTSDLNANGCYVKKIDINNHNNTLIVDIITDCVIVKDIVDIREEKINHILDKTSDD